MSKKQLIRMWIKVYQQDVLRDARLTPPRCSAALFGTWFDTGVHIPVEHSVLFYDPSDRYFIRVPRGARMFIGQKPNEREVDPGWEASMILPDQSRLIVLGPTTRGKILFRKNNIRVEFSPPVESEWEEWYDD